MKKGNRLERTEGRTLISNILTKQFLILLSFSASAVLMDFIAIKNLIISSKSGNF